MSFLYFLFKKNIEPERAASYFFNCLKAEIEKKFLTENFQDVAPKIFVAYGLQTLRIESPSALWNEFFLPGIESD